jgi:hypothetical protein
LNRAERRRNKREKEKLSKSIDKLTPNQLKLIDMYSEQKADKLLDSFKQLIIKSMINSMRQNRISLERANKVIEDANKIMDVEVNKKYE